ncbi:DUF4817 domain-containing protein [Trichonephila clavipes]|nr:DUF4817 domain-containing protein [Trichonephila clavipes]
MYTYKLLHFHKVTVGYGFPGYIIIGLRLFDTQCPVNGRKKVKVNVQRYLMLLLEKVAPSLREKAAFSTIIFMQDGATSHSADLVKKFLIQTFGEEIIVSKRCKFSLLARSPDLTPADFWLWG